MIGRRWAGAIVLAAASLAAVAGSAAEARPRLLERLREAREARSEGARTLALRVGGLDRTYLLLDAHRGAGPAPLVIVLHGGGGSPESMMPRWTAKARAAGFVVAAPKGIGRKEKAGTWNAVGCCGEAATRGVDDIAFVAAVIDDVSRRRAVDPGRIYVAGFSNGGMLTHRVAIALGDRIAAAAVVSGAMFGNESPARAPVAMLIIHGEKDPAVPFAGGGSDTGAVAKAQTLPFEPVRQAVAYWRTANGCKGTAVLERPGLRRETGTGCRDAADVVFYDLPQGGHSWPGAPAWRRGADAEPPAPIDATDVIWTFFARHGR